MCRLAFDQLEKTVLHVRRRHEQLSVVSLPRVTREGVEQIADVCADRGAAGDQAKLRVLARGLGVVVAGTHMDVPANSVRLAPHDHRDLRVRLEGGGAVRHVHAEALELPRPRDVVGFVEARLRSEEHTSELQSRQYLVCRLLLEKKKQTEVQL